MESKDWDETFRKLKSEGILAKDVAIALSLDESYISRMKKRKESFTKENFDLFNKLYGKYVTLHPSLIYKLPAANESKRPIGNALEETVEDLAATVRVLQEYIARRVARVDNVSSESVYFELSSLKAELFHQEKSKGIQSGLGKQNSSERKKRF